MLRKLKGRNKKLIRWDVLKELEDIFYKQEISSFLESFVSDPQDVKTGKAPPTAPTSSAQVLADIKEIWQKNDHSVLHPVDLRQQLLSKYMPEADPNLLKVFEEVERSNYQPEKMTGFLDKSHLGLVSGLGHLCAETSDQKIAMVEVDFSNMGGTNEYFREIVAKQQGIETKDLPVTEVFEYTDQSARLVAKTIQAELQDVLPKGGEILPIRAGGDELRFIVSGIDESQHASITQAVHEKIERHMASLDLHDHIHLKGRDNALKNGFGAAVSFVAMKGIDPANVVHKADGHIKANKDNLGHGRLGKVDMDATQDKFACYFPDEVKLQSYGAFKEISHVATFLVHQEKQKAAEIKAEFEALKNTTAGSIEAKSAYISSALESLGIDDVKANGAANPDFLQREQKAAPMFATPGERRFMKIENEVENRKVQVNNEYESIYLKQVAERTVAVDSSAATWMPNEMPEMVEITVNDTEKLKEDLRGNVDFDVDAMKPMMLGVAFHNLGGLNEIVGHDGANEALRHMSQDIIINSFEQEGLALGDFQISHYGGAEFQIVVQPAIKDPETGNFKVVEAEALQRVSNRISAGVDGLNQKQVAQFLDAAGSPPDTGLRETLGQMKFADIKDVKQDRDISGMAVVSNIQEVTLKGQERSGAFIHRHREALSVKVDERRLEILADRQKPSKFITGDHKFKTVDENHARLPEQINGQKLGDFIKNDAQYQQLKDTYKNNKDEHSLSALEQLKQNSQKQKPEVTTNTPKQTSPVTAQQTHKKPSKPSMG